MTENKKKKLEQLLKDAVTSLEIRSKNGTPSPHIIPITTYKQALTKSWNYHTTNWFHDLDGYSLHIMNENSRLNLLEFISEHYESFIHKDRIHNAMGMISSNGNSIIFLLEQILRIYIVYGIEKVVSKMRDTKGSFQFISLLEGITINAEIHISENLKVIPRLTSEKYLKNPLPRFITDSSLESKRMHELMNPLGKTLLVSTCSISSIFLKPIQDENPSFGMKFNGEKYSYPNMKVICDKFANSLSLACNSPVQISKTWVSIEKDEIFNFCCPLYRSDTNIDVAKNYYMPKTSKIGQNEVSRAKTIFDNLEQLNSKDQDRIKTSIDEWIKSKIAADDVDKLKHLRTAFEKIFALDKPGEITYRFSLCGAFLLGKTPSDRQKLQKSFRDIYDCCSKAVHNGKIHKKYTRQINEFIEDTQNLCRDSIMKILDAGKPTKPNEWDDLITGMIIL